MGPDQSSNPWATRNVHGHASTPTPLRRDRHARRGRVVPTVATSGNNEATLRLHTRRSHKRGKRTAKRRSNSGRRLSRQAETKWASGAVPRSHGSNHLSGGLDAQRPQPLHEAAVEAMADGSSTLSTRSKARSMELVTLINSFLIANDEHWRSGHSCGGRVVGRAEGEAVLLGWSVLTPAGRPSRPNSQLSLSTYSGPRP